MPTNTNMLTVQYNWKNPEGKDELINLNADTVKRFIATGGSPNDQEIYYFMQLCKYMRYNPMIKEAYLVKYGTQPANIIVSKDLFAKRAEPHPAYLGYQIEDNYHELKPRLMKKDYSAIWELEVTVRMFRKDRKFPFEIVVDYIEYVGTKYDNQTGKRVPNSMWSFPGGKPRTMLRKVALAQAYRAAFPNLLTGYVQEELEKEHDDNLDIPVSETEIKVTNINKDGEVVEEDVEIDKRTGEIKEKKPKEKKGKVKEEEEKTNKKEEEERNETEDDSSDIIPETEDQKSERIKNAFTSNDDPIIRVNGNPEDPLMEGDVGAEQIKKDKTKKKTKSHRDKIVTIETFGMNPEDLDIEEGVDEYMYELDEFKQDKTRRMLNSRFFPISDKGIKLREKIEKGINEAEWKKYMLWFWGSTTLGKEGYRTTQILKKGNI